MIKTKRIWLIKCSEGSIPRVKSVLKNSDTTSVDNVVSVAIETDGGKPIKCNSCNVAKEHGSSGGRLSCEAKLEMCSCKISCNCVLYNRI